MKNTLNNYKYNYLFFYYFNFCQIQKIFIGLSSEFKLAYTSERDVYVNGRVFEEVS